MSRWLIILFLSFFLGSCARAPLKKREEALRLTGAPALEDDLSLEPLIEAVKRQSSILKASPQGPKITFGKKQYRREEYAAALDQFVGLAEQYKDPKAFFRAVQDSFHFYEVYGNEGWGEVLVTSYFEPEINGSLKKTDKYTQALLKAPGDLIEVAVSKYDDRFSDLGTMRGRLVAAPFPPGKLLLVPYFNREEIDSQGILSKRNLELAWVDPIDAFFMQIQGSGTVLLESGQRLRLGYADQNGHRYESIGKFLVDVLPKDKITMPVIESYLRSLPAEKVTTLLNKNPSYVFFRERDGLPTTAFGTPAVAGRTIATDPRFFSKGTLGFLTFEKPKWASSDAAEPSGFEKTSRFVLDDDTGGAIRGGGRVDLFWGSGAEARRNAGVIKHPGRLYYLAPKSGS